MEVALTNGPHLSQTRRLLMLQIVRGPIGFGAAGTPCLEWELRVAADSESCWSAQQRLRHRRRQRTCLLTTAAWRSCKRRAQHRAGEIEILRASPALDGTRSAMPLRAATASMWRWRRGCLKKWGRHEQRLSRADHGRPPAIFRTDAVRTIPAFDIVSEAAKEMALKGSCSAAFAPNRPRQHCTTAADSNNAAQPAPP